MNSILLKNIKTTEKSLKETVDYTDINYLVKKENKPTILKGIQCEINRYKIWLQSSRSDYLRNYGFGGFFDNQLNDRYPFTDDSIPTIKADLERLTSEKFPDIELLGAEIKRDVNRRAWLVRVAVLDRKTGLPALDMFTQNENIVVFAQDNS
jgi:hypothetical protein